MPLIKFRDRFIQMNNMLFDRLVHLAVEVAERAAGVDEQSFVDGMRRIRDECFSGRGFDIEEDFPDIAERKFWCRVFFDTARAILDGSAGIHTQRWWQSLTIHLTYGTAMLLEDAVRDVEPGWHADTQDRREEIASRETPPQ